MKLGPLPKGSKVLVPPVIMVEQGFLYFKIEPWSQAKPVYIMVPSRGTLRAMRYWLERIADWPDTGTVTHLNSEAHLL